MNPHRAAGTTSPRVLGLAVCFSLALVAIALLFAITPVAHANSIVVDSFQDDNQSGHCTLREAILAANTHSAVATCAAGSGNDVISFSITGTIVLSHTLGFLPITDTLTIIGPTPGGISISGFNPINSTRVISIASGITVSLSYLTIESGQTTGPNSEGAGIRNQGNLYISNSTLTNNTSGSNGGGIWNSGFLSVTNTTFSIDGAQGNTSPQDGGGGIYNIGTLILTNSTFDSNTALKNGAGLENTGTGINPAVAFITNTTFYHNIATTAQGGGIFNGPFSNVDVTNATFAGNEAVSGAGLYTLGPSGYGATVRDTIFVDNSTGNCDHDFSSAVTDGGNNLRWPSSDATCVGTVADPQLGALANNGGPTQTMALLRASPAIDAGSDATCPGADQRGVPRPIGAHCDIGAYEAPLFLFLPLIVK